MQVREKEDMKHCGFQYFPMICGCGSKVGLLKRWVRSHAGTSEMNNCTPLWREARSEVHRNVGALLEVQIQMLKTCTSLWRQARLEANMQKALQCQSGFGS